MPFEPDSPDGATPGFQPEASPGFVPDDTQPTPGFVPESPSPQGVETPPNQEQSSWYAPSRLIPTATRFAGAGLASEGGPSGAATAGAAETLAETEERLFGTRSEYSPREVAASAATGLIPFGKLAGALGATGRAGRALAGAAEGAVLGPVATTVQSEVSKGELPSGEDVALSAGLGLGFGAAGGAVSKEAPKVADTVETETEKARRQLALGQGEKLAKNRQYKETGAEASNYVNNLSPEAQRDLNDRWEAHSESTSLTGRLGADLDQSAALRARGFTPEEQPHIDALLKISNAAADDMESAGLEFGRRPYYAPLDVATPGDAAGGASASPELATGRLKPRSRTLVEIRQAGEQLKTENLADRVMGGAMQESNLAMKRRVLNQQLEEGTFKLLQPEKTPQEKFGLGPPQETGVPDGMAMLDPKISDQLQLPRMYGPVDAVKAFNDELLSTATNPKLQTVRNLVNGIRQFRVAFGAYHYFNTAYNAVGEGLARGDIAGTLTGRDAYSAFKLGQAVSLEADTADHLAGNLSENFKKVMKGGFNLDIERRFSASLGQMMQEEGQSAGLKAFGKIGGKIQNVMDRISTPIMKRFVPYMKIGTYLKNVEAFEADAGRAATDAEMYQMARHTDAVFGQMSDFNSPLSKTMRRVMGDTIQYPGWNLGSFQLGKDTVKGVGKMLARVPLNQREDQATRFALGLTMASAIGGTILHTLSTGKPPETMMDVFYPRTGKKNPDGTDERIQQQNYIRDAVSIGHGVPGKLAHGEVSQAVGQLAQNAIRTLTSKTGMLINIPFQLAQNEDASGRQILSPEGGLAKNAAELTKYAAKETVPFAAQSMFSGKGDRPPPLGLKGQVLGFQRAPEFLSETEAETEASDLAHKKSQAQGAITPEQDVKRGAKSQAMQAIRNKDPDAPAKLAAAISSGALPKKEIKEFLIESGLPPLLSRVYEAGLDDTMKIYKVASPKERKEMLPFILEKIKKTGNVGALHQLSDSGLGF